MASSAPAQLLTCQQKHNSYKEQDQQTQAGCSIFRVREGRDHNYQRLPKNRWFSGLDSPLNLLAYIPFIQHKLKLGGRQKIRRGDGG